MKRTISFSVIALLVAGVMTVPAVAQLTFVQAKPVPVEDASDFKKPVNSGKTAELALRVHEVMYNAGKFKDIRARLFDAQQKYDWDQMRYQSLTACNVKNLKPYFEKPQEAWQKIVDKYDQDEKKLAIQIGTTAANFDEFADPMTGIPGLETYLDASKVDSPEMTTSDLSEMFLMWSLGNGILTKMYADQDEWGKRIDKSFPLTADQRYIYDEMVWFPKYRELNQAACCKDNCNVGWNGRPDTRENGYDYHADYKYFEDGKVEMAHKAFIAALTAVRTANNQTCIRAFTPGMLTMPQTPPKPLPPTGETVAYAFQGKIVNDTVVPAESLSRSVPPFSEGRIYKDGKMELTASAWPAPWKTFIDSGFKTYNANGEMAGDFKYKSFELKQKTMIENMASNNRLNSYQITKKDLDDSKKALDGLKVAYVEILNNIKTQVDDINQVIEGANAENAQNASTMELPVPQLSKIQLSDGFEYVSQFNTDDLAEEVERVVVKSGTIYFQQKPNSELMAWPDKFDVNNEISSGNLVVLPDTRGIGKVYLKTAPIMAKKDFDLLSDVEIKALRDSARTVRDALINQAMAELNIELQKDADLPQETKDRRVAQTVNLKKEADTKSQRNEFLGMAKSIVSDASAQADKVKGYISNAFAERDVSESAVWPNAVEESSKENTARMLNALKQDTNGDVLITRSNAARIEDVKKEQLALDALVKQYPASAPQKPGELDANCLNLGMYK